MTTDPTLLFMVGAVTVGVLVSGLWRATNRHYTEKAEDYWNREYLDYSDRLDNIIIPVPRGWQ